MTTIKMKKIYLEYPSGEYETRDKRYETKMPLKKVCKYCLDNGFSFKVGFHDNTLISNKNYIEITDETFCHALNDDYEDFIKKSNNLKKWLWKISEKKKG